MRMRLGSSCDNSFAFILSLSFVALGMVRLIWPQSPSERTSLGTQRQAILVRDSKPMLSHLQEVFGRGSRESERSGGDSPRYPCRALRGCALGDLQADIRALPGTQRRADEGLDLMWTAQLGLLHAAPRPVARCLSRAALRADVVVGGGSRNRPPESL